MNRDQRFLIDAPKVSSRGLCPATQGQDTVDPAECTTKPGLIHANACDAQPPEQPLARVIGGPC